MGMLQSLGPTFLLPGTQVGPWRVLESAGEGVYGFVYRVERVGHESAGPFALKMAKYPQDPRYEREGHLLSIVDHPHVPRLHDRGEWTVGGGLSLPFIVMEFIEGLPLYAWAEAQLRSHAQQLRLLAHVARALEATHAVGGLHRDVKGGNILVRQQRTEAVLMDFGSAYYHGAPILTRHLPPPGTPQYQSPESQRFEWEHLLSPTVRYEAQPADDVYALGMTAYRLLTGSYPPPLVQVETTGKGYRLVHRPLVLPEHWEAANRELAALLHQMLAAEPATRGTAGEVAQALEREAETSKPERSASPVTPVPRLEASTQPGASSLPPRTLRSRRPWLAATAAAAVLSAALWWSQQPSRAKRPTTMEREAQRRGNSDTGTAELADSALPMSTPEAAPEPTRRGFALVLPKKPLPGQSRAPCMKPAVEINGGCWSGPTEETPPCGTRSYAWKNGCYQPILEPPKPTTSEPR